MRKNWCDFCRKQVLPIKVFNRRAFFILLLITFIGGIIYLIYYLVSTGDTCPICKQNKYLRYIKPKEKFIPHPPEQIILQAKSSEEIALKFCPYCGSKLANSGNYCGKCDITI
jgi:hypothetical protein